MLKSISSHRATSTIQNVFIHVTKTCNLRCCYCYYSAGKPSDSEMTTKEFADALIPLVSKNVAQGKALEAAITKLADNLGIN